MAPTPRTPPSPEEIAFGRRVEALMRARGLTPADVAERIGSSSSNVRKIWGGNAVRQYLQLQRLAQAIGVTPHELLGIDGAMIEKKPILNAIQAVVETLGFDRDLARQAAQIALEASTRQLVLDEPDEAEIRAAAKILMRQAFPQRSGQ